jgi:hypothetical protein
MSVAVDTSQITAEEWVILLMTHGNIPEGVGYDHLRMNPEEWDALFAGGGDTGQEAPPDDGSSPGVPDTAGAEN